MKAMKTLFALAVMMLAGNAMAAWQPGTITVRSWVLGHGWDTGVTITNSNPADYHHTTTGNTQFTMDYIGPGATTTLTAPPTANGVAFTCWRIGSDVYPNPITVSFGGTITVIAMYGVLETVHVEASPAEAGQVAVVADTADFWGSTGGTTPFDLTYGQGTHITLTAPATAAGAYSLSQWMVPDRPSGNGFAGELSVALTMDGSFATATALYALPPTPVLPPASNYRVVGTTMGDRPHAFPILPMLPYGQYDGSTYTLFLNGSLYVTSGIAMPPDAVLSGSVDMVDTFHACSTPTAGMLLPLDMDGKIISTALRQGSDSGLDADKVDGIHASGVATSHCLIPLDDNALLPSYVIPWSEFSPKDFVVKETFNNRILPEPTTRSAWSMAFDPGFNLVDPDIMDEFHQSAWCDNQGFSWNAVWGSVTNVYYAQSNGGDSPPSLSLIVPEVRPGRTYLVTVGIKSTRATGPLSVRLGGNSSILHQFAEPSWVDGDGIYHCDTANGLYSAVVDTDFFGHNIFQLIWGPHTVPGISDQNIGIWGLSIEEWTFGQISTIGYTSPLDGGRPVAASRWIKMLAPTSFSDDVLVGGDMTVKGDMTVIGAMHTGRWDELEAGNIWANSHVGAGYVDSTKAVIGSDGWEDGSGWRTGPRYMYAALTDMERLYNLYPDYGEGADFKFLNSDWTREDTPVYGGWKTSPTGASNPAPLELAYCSRTWPHTTINYSTAKTKIAPGHKYAMALAIVASSNATGTIWARIGNSTQQVCDISIIPEQHNGLFVFEGIPYVGRSEEVVFEADATNYVDRLKLEWRRDAKNSGEWLVILDAENVILTSVNPSHIYDRTFEVLRADTAISRRFAFQGDVNDHGATADDATMNTHFTEKNLLGSVAITTGVIMSRDALVGGDLTVLGSITANGGVIGGGSGAAQTLQQVIDTGNLVSELCGDIIVGTHEDSVAFEIDAPGYALWTRGMNHFEGTATFESRITASGGITGDLTGRWLNYTTPTLADLGVTSLSVAYSTSTLTSLGYTTPTLAQILAQGGNNGTTNPVNMATTATQTLGWAAYTTPTLTSLGHTTPTLAQIGYTTPSLANLGYSTPTLTSIGYTTPSLANLGYSTPTLTSIGYTTPSLANLGYSTPTLTSLGYTTPSLANLGYSTPTLTSLGHTTPTLAQIGYTTPTLSDLGYTTPSGTGTYTTPTLSDLGYTTPTLADLGYTTPSGTGTYTTPSLADLGYTSPTIDALETAALLMDDNSASTNTITDSTGHWTAALTGAASTGAYSVAGASGIANTAIQFTTNGLYVASTDRTFGSRGDLSMAFWMNISANNNMNMIDKMATGAPYGGFRIYTNSSRALMFDYGQGGTAYTYNLALTPTLGNWYHLVLRYRKADNHAEIWINGAVQKSWTDASMNMLTTELMLMGNAWNNNANKNTIQTWTIDDVRLFDGSYLTDYQILCIQRAAAPPSTSHYVMETGGKAFVPNLARWVPIQFSTAMPTSYTINTGDTSSLRAGMPVSYILNTSSYYGQITAVTAGVSFSFSGPAAAGALNKVYIGSPEMIVQIDIPIAGAYGASTGNKLLSDMHTYTNWQFASAYLVGFKGWHKTNASTTQPKVNVMIGANKVSTNDSNNGIQCSSASWTANPANAINASYYAIANGGTYDVNCTVIGAGTTPASDLVISTVWVLP